MISWWFHFFVPNSTCTATSRGERSAVFDVPVLLGGGREAGGGIKAAGKGGSKGKGKSKGAAAGGMAEAVGLYTLNQVDP